MPANRENHFSFFIDSCTFNSFGQIFIPKTSDMQEIIDFVALTCILLEHSRLETGQLNRQSQGFLFFHELLHLWLISAIFQSPKQEKCKKTSDFGVLTGLCLEDSPSETSQLIS